MAERPHQLRPGRWADRAALSLQVAAGTAVGLVLVQSVLAGHLLTGQAVALDLHGVVGTEVFLTLAGLQLLSSLVWAVTGGARVPVLVTAGLFVLVTAQSNLGFQGRLALHVPLALLILLAQLWLYLATRRARRAADRETTRG